MERRFTRGGCRTAALVGFCGLVLGALPGLAPASEHSGSAQYQAAHSPHEQREVAEYWTEDRMRGAAPAEVLVDTTPTQTSPDPVPRGAARTIPPVSPTGPVSPQAFPDRGSRWTGGGAVTRTAGRVFFTHGGRDSSCSGNAVTSENESTVLTAGHCVRMNGRWHDNWVFVPGYRDGERPHGTWVARDTYATAEWTSREDLDYDVGAAVVNRRNGNTLTDTVGAQGLAFNQARKQPMYAFGYPAAPPYDGSRLIYCSGDAFNDRNQTDALGLRCTMTGGSSGGPWFLRFSESVGTGLQNSVTSFKYSSRPGWLFGPYFGSSAERLYETAQASAASEAA